VLTSAAVFQDIFPTLLEQVSEHIQREIAAYRNVPLAGLRERTRAALVAFSHDLSETPFHHYYDYMYQLSFERNKEGIPLAIVQLVLRLLNDDIINAVRAHLPKGDEILVDTVDICHRITETGMIGMYTGYEEAQLEIIAAQQTALQELSTPIIPIHEGILVLPMVGSIDSRRAGQIMEGLLEGISAHTADVVILDITGVPVIDTGVANYLLQAARAARLLGSTVVLVGIGAEIAQTMVQLGIDLTGIVTRANLQTGIEYALALQGLAIKPI
jgi:rsbT co-antagonist protein RsbR